jgi:SAM-dependent methyltransferase
VGKEQERLILRALQGSLTEVIMNFKNSAPEEFSFSGKKGSQQDPFFPTHAMDKIRPGYEPAPELIFSKSGTVLPMLSCENGSKGIAIGPGAENFITLASMTPHAPEFEIQDYMTDGYDSFLSLHAPDSYLDYVYLNLSACHLRALYSAFKEINRALKNEGCLIISVIDKNTAYGKQLQERSREPFQPNTLQTYSIHKILFELSETGFIHVDIEQVLAPTADLPETTHTKPGFGKGPIVVIKALKKKKIKNRL